LLVKKFVLLTILDKDCAMLYCRYIHEKCIFVVIFAIYVIIYTV
jgi:hypothetical protein